MAETGDFDVVVLGAGAGGGFAAMALAEAGLRVLVLERGPRRDPRDYPMNHDDWELRDNPFALPPGPDPTLAFAAGAPLAPDTADLCGYTPAGEPARRTPPRRGRFLYQRVFGVGGTTLHYQGEAHRYAEHCFRSASEYGFGVDWPLGYAELAPWYEQVERILGVAGEPGNPFKPARGPFPTPAHALCPASRRLRGAAAELGWSLLPNSLALPTRSVDGRTPCQRSGGCVQGCIFGAKSSVDQTAIPRGERTGRLVVESGARALQLETAADGRVSAAVYRRGGEMRRAVGRVFVLAMGALETPRLLLVSQDGRAARGTGNDADQVGRHLTETVWVGLTVRFDERLEPYKGPPIDARIWDFNRPAQPGRSGFGLGVSGTMSGYHGPVSYAERTPGFGLVHKRAMRERFGTIVTLFGIADHEPRAENRVELSDQTDSEGVPLLRVRSSYSEADRAVVGEMMRRCRELAEASGARETVDLYSSYDRPASSHPAGTCRMGADPASSVVDAWGRVHGVANLYITDASVLPGQGAGDAPTLTIQALALRTAGHIAARARRREL